MQVKSERHCSDFFRKMLRLRVTLQDLSALFDDSSTNPHSCNLISGRKVEKSRRSCGAVGMTT